MVSITIAFGGALVFVILGTVYRNRFFWEFGFVLLALGVAVGVLVSYLFPDDLNSGTITAFSIAVRLVAIISIQLLVGVIYILRVKPKP